LQYLYFIHEQHCKDKYLYSPIWEFFLLKKSQIIKDGTQLQESISWKKIIIIKINKERVPNA
jgi:cytochrome c oxidase subunit IV